MIGSWPGIVLAILGFLALAFWLSGFSKRSDDASPMPDDVPAPPQPDPEPVPEPDEEPAPESKIEPAILAGATAPASPAAPSATIEDPLEASPAPLDGSAPSQQFLSAVHEESFRNADGSSRQTILAGCVAGEPMRLICEPDNPYDREAVKVCRLNGEQIGYLPRGDGMAETIRSRRPIVTTLWKVDSDGAAEPRFGAVLQINIW